MSSLVDLQRSLQLSRQRERDTARDLTGHTQGAQDASGRDLCDLSRSASIGEAAAFLLSGDPRLIWSFGSGFFSAF